MSNQLHDDVAYIRQRVDDLHSYIGDLLREGNAVHSRHDTDIALLKQSRSHATWLVGKIAALVAATVTGLCGLVLLALQIYFGS